MKSALTCLWFDSQAEEAARFYSELFDDTTITNTMRTPDGAGVLVVELSIKGHVVSLLNGGPTFTQTEAASIMVRCEDQPEVDRYWDALTADGGRESMCGWCADRWGVWWQITPDELLTIMTGPDRERAGRAMQSFMTMRKLDLPTILAAADGG